MPRDEGPEPARPEERRLHEVYLSLVALFPDLPVEVVEAAVRHEARQLDGPIREFVPILVRRAAFRRLCEFATPVRALEEPAEPIS